MAGLASPRGGGNFRAPQQRAMPGGTMMPNLTEFNQHDEAHIAKIQAACRGKQTRKEMKQNMSGAQVQKLEQAQAHANQRRELYSDVQALLGVSRVDYSVRPALQKAHEYVTKHRIMDLMKILCARISLERPEDFRGRLIELLEEMKAQRGVPNMGMITTEDLETMFSMQDAHNLGEISAMSAVSCLESLGCGKNARSAVDDGLAKAQGAAAKRGMIDRNTFMKICIPEVEAFFMAPKLSS